MSTQPAPTPAPIAPAAATPGPWRVLLTYHQAAYPEAPHRITVCPQADPLKHVADCGPYLNGPRPDADDQSEDRNNARLIAAAPELRDALAALARAIGRIDGYEDILMDPENAARALLARLGVTL
jgi:hypothetical protein